MVNNYYYAENIKIIKIIHAFVLTLILNISFVRLKV